MQEQVTILLTLYWPYHGWMESHTPDREYFHSPRRLSHQAARMEQLVYWSGKSIPERLAAMTALNRRMLEMRGIAYDELDANLTPRRVRRSRD